MPSPELAAPKALAEPKDREFALGLYLVLAALFVSSLVTCNLAFRKFFAWTLPGLDYTFEASVGLLPYPLTFLVTDLISEVYGRKRADDVVKAGLAASLLTLAVITLAGAAPATAWSPVTDGEFDHVFGQTALAVGASMAAYLLAQFLDVRIFHFWKMRTGGRMLWLRNNFSTIPSQFVDTMVAAAAVQRWGNRMGPVRGLAGQWIRLQGARGRGRHPAGLPRGRMVPPPVRT